MLIVGRRFYEGCRVVVLTAELRCINLPPRLDLYNHSPTGFEWGYGGSGPAQLALAMLAYSLADDARAVRLHQSYKWRVVSQIKDEVWTIPTVDVRQVAAWLEENVPHMKGAEHD